MPNAVRRARVDQRASGLGEVAHVRRAPALVVDDRNLVLFRTESEHRSNEVVPCRAKEPGGPHDPRLLAGCCLTVELRAAIGRSRIDGVGLGVRLALLPGEHVVGREHDEGSPELRRMLRPAHVHLRRALRIILGAVDVRPRRGVEHQVDRAQAGRRRKRDVPPLPGARDNVRVGEDLAESRAELAVGAGDQDAARSRLERIGDRVLQRWATRGSFHGTPCSSGSAGSYSLVTW